MSRLKIFSGLLMLICASPVVAHHSFFGRFDTTSSIELEGRVTAVSWRNPHAHIELEVLDNTGRVTVWDLESGSPTLMQRAGIPRDAIQVGQMIRVAAYPPTTNVKEAFATNVLLESGQELVMQTGANAVFSNQSIGDFSYRFRTEGDRSRPELGIFRIWTFTGAVPFLFPESIDRTFDLNSYPMTDAAKAALANFNPATDNPTNNCTPKGMPTIMEQPLPIEILQDGENILLKIEEYDLRRTIFMTLNQAPPGTTRTPLGFSTGKWQDDTLVVTTTHISWPHFNQSGIPQSEQSVLTERFRVVEEGSEMEYQLMVDDSVNFTKPVTLSKKWLYIPDVELIPFECLDKSLP